MTSKKETCCSREVDYKIPVQTPFNRNMQLLGMQHEYIQQLKRVQNYNDDVLTKYLKRRGTSIRDAAARVQRANLKSSYNSATNLAQFYRNAKEACKTKSY